MSDTLHADLGSVRNCMHVWGHVDVRVLSGRRFLMRMCACFVCVNAELHEGRLLSISESLHHQKHGG